MSHGPPEPEVSPQKRLTLATGTCEHCRGPLPDRPNRGSLRRFCSARCRSRAWMTRQRDEAVATYRAELAVLLAQAPTRRRE